MFLSVGSGLTFTATCWLSHAADHDLAAGQAVAGVRVGQAALPVQIDGLHHLDTRKGANT